MSKREIYLAGAMEIYGNKLDHAKQWRELCKDWFKRYSDDFKVVSPTDFYEYGKSYHKTDEEVFRFDLRKVKSSDVVLVNLNDIRKSIGTCMELKEANTYDIPIIGFVENDIPTDELIKLIHPWVYCCCDRVETGKNAMTLAMSYILNYYC